MFLCVVTELAKEYFAFFFTQDHGAEIVRHAPLVTILRAKSVALWKSFEAPVVIWFMRFLQQSDHQTALQ